MQKCRAGWTNETLNLPPVALAIFVISSAYILMMILSANICAGLVFGIGMGLTVWVTVRFIAAHRSREHRKFDFKTTDAILAIELILEEREQQVLRKQKKIPVIQTVYFIPDISAKIQVVAVNPSEYRGKHMQSTLIRIGPVTASNRSVIREMQEHIENALSDDIAPELVDYVPPEYRTN